MLRSALNKPPNNDVTSDSFEQAVTVEILDSKIKSWAGGCLLTPLPKK
jgi:hypothetical protein